MRILALHLQHSLYKQNRKMKTRLLFVQLIILINYFDKMRKEGEKHPIESVGEELRSMMPWISANKLVDKNKN